MGSLPLNKLLEDFLGTKNYGQEIGIFEISLFLIY